MLITLQRRIAEAGRIRIGVQVPSGRGTRPSKLETFRLTSSDKRRIEQAAEAYGGKVEEWQAPAGRQWQVITERAELDVIVPPADLSFSQHFELWSAGGCQRRCDGQTESLSGSDCLCDPEDRECDIHTRLSVLLRDLPGLGVWRIDTQGYYAAVELAGAVELIRLAAGTRLLPARLRLDQRSVKRPGENGKPQTRKFAVPVLDLEVSPASLLTGGEGVALLPTLEQRPPLTPVPALPPGSGPTIAEQSQPPAARPRRANSAPPIPTSGRSRAGASTEQSGSSGPDEESAAEAPSETTSSARSSGRGRSCTHPADRRVTTEAGAVVCGVDRCGEVLQPAPETDEPVEGEYVDQEKPKGRPRAAAKKSEGDEGYWLARIHAAGSERGIDHEGLRLIAGALRKIPTDQVADYSLSELPDSTAEGIDKLLRSIADGPIDVDRATEWVAKIAAARGLRDAEGEADWSAIDPIAAGAISGALEDATPAAWIAFGLRLHAGEYDSKEA